MAIEQYTAGDHQTLRSISARLPPCHSLLYPDFVDAYYATSSYASLFIMRDEDGRVLGTCGVERMPFETPDGRLTIAFGNNFHSFEKGAGGMLFMQWVRQGKFGIHFGGTEDARRITDGQKWKQYRGIQMLDLNVACADFPGDAAWKRAAKLLLRHSPLRCRVDARANEFLHGSTSHVEAIPEAVFSPDMLPAGPSPFAVRFAPDVEYLNWRYATRDGIVRYHPFRIVAEGESAGFVVLNEQTHRVIVSHCDATDPVILARGIFAALAQLCRGRLRRCGVLLTTSHPVISGLATEFGFRKRREGRSIAIGALGGRQPKLPEDVSQWLVSEDWGDNGLRAPFRGIPLITQRAA